MIDQLDPQIELKANKEVAMLITETCSTIYEPKSYDETINIPIHRRH